MAWKVEIKSSAVKEITRFDKTTQRRIFDFLKEIESSTDPRILLQPYAGPLAGYWKKRLGDYRLICEIDDRTITVIVMKAGHRSKVYD
ncbi:MAG: type II toxin-antitoxin system RelE/ParE family toxin [Thiobacillaceae bacterium]